MKKDKFKGIAIAFTAISIFFLPIEAMAALLSIMACDNPDVCKGLSAVPVYLALFSLLIVLTLLIFALVFIVRKKYVQAFWLSFISLFPILLIVTFLIINLVSISF